MRLPLLGLALGAALIATPAAAATITEPVRDAHEVRTHLFWYPADRVWTGGLPLEACGPRFIQPAGELAFAPPLRRANYERRGELVAELRAPPKLAPAVLTQARACVAKAAGEDADRVMLGPAPPVEAFRASLAACLKDKGAHEGVGSMTLWIDTSCNW